MPATTKPMRPLLPLTTIYKNGGWQAVTAIAAALLTACTTTGIEGPAALSEDMTATLEFDRQTVRLTMPGNTAARAIRHPFVIPDERLDPSTPGSTAGAWYPLQLIFERSDTRSAPAYQIRIGAMRDVPDRDLTEVPPATLLQESRDFQERLIGGIEGPIGEMHRSNFRAFELYDAGDITWVRHISEGILGHVWDLYSTPVDDDTFLHVLFMYSRDRWKNDKAWFAEREQLGKSILASLEVIEK